MYQPSEVGSVIEVVLLAAYNLVILLAALELIVVERRAGTLRES